MPPKSRTDTSSSPSGGKGSSAEKGKPGKPKQGKGKGADGAAAPAPPPGGLPPPYDPDSDQLPIGEDALQKRMQPAPTFNATTCPHCGNAFEVQIDYEEIKDMDVFEQKKKRELDIQQKAYQAEISRFQEEVNSLKETMANLCNQLAQAQVENLRTKQAGIEQDQYIAQLKEHLKKSEEELHHLAYDFERSVGTDGTGPVEAYTSNTAQRIIKGDRVPAPNTTALAGSPPHITSGGMATGGVVMHRPPTAPPPQPYTPPVLPPTTTPAGRNGSPQRGLASAPPIPIGRVAQEPSAQPFSSYSGDVMLQDRRERFRQRLIHFYSVHNPEKMGEVDSILREFEGQEEVMFAMLARKYCTGPITDPDQTGPMRTAPTLMSGGDPMSGYDSYNRGGMNNRSYRSHQQHHSFGLQSQAEDDHQLRQVAPWTLQMRAYSKRGR